MVRIYLFLIQIGIDKNRIRFRQHMKNEMAHYASDCWDAECEISTGWIECVGYADRSDYDLSHHTICSSEQLVAKRKLPTPKQIQVNERKIIEKNIGQIFRKETPNIIRYLENLSENDAQILHEKLEQKYERRGGFVRMIIGFFCCLVRRRLRLMRRNLQLHEKCLHFKQSKRQSKVNISI
jgi:glycyl-tRNA synthetase